MRQSNLVVGIFTVLAAGALPLPLAGCGRAGSGGTNTTAPAGHPGSAAEADGWKATDACAVINEAAVATAAGGTIKRTTLGAVKAEGGGFPLYSQCEILFEDGRMLVFATAEGTKGESVADQVADTRRQVKMVATTEPVQVSGLGKAAIWVPDVHQLYVFLGDRRYISATLSQTDFRRKADAPETIKAQEIAILRTAGA